MQQQELGFQPILLGSDINVYGMARSFYEEYGIVSTIIASRHLLPTKYTKILTVEQVPGFSKDPVFIEHMRKVAERNKQTGKKYLLIACGDGYAELVSKHKEELSKDFICPYVDFDLFEKLSDKESFYNVCETYNLPYPGTFIITKEMANKKESIQPPFEYPVALKPANSIEYLNVDFEGRKKAFRIKSQEEFDDIVQKIYNAGYSADMIAQDFIPGDDSNMRVLNAYVDQNHKVRMMCLGHPLLEDPTPDAIGNYVAILADYNQEIYQTIQRFLEEINYTGFANFDMKYDPRDGKYKLFEINLRQGRSSFFVTLSGYNLAKYVTEDRVFQKPFTETVYGNGNMLWLGVPKKIFFKYVKPSEDKTKAEKLLTEKKYGTTIFYKKDFSIKRYLVMYYTFYKYIDRFKKYFKENKG
ncbi:carboxylate--amine ligase [Enterococcus rivorum]|uniref:Carboxylate--amine ligase n=1 Tax=Enterococcus rivorum TaxID=762845 RepID=A0A1E5KVD9_9ENTE|nr:carboxylate--amine ligase [Enterococcus rivorum]MBP2100593.1 D-aspartate ligase [Enterococcus rivorum]OEH81559.1 carboxylate--amine ligase [Enterococcus rivorum]